MRKNIFFKLIIVIALFIYGVYYAQTSTDWHFIDNVNLLIHEAGHVVFYPFGWTLYVLGGSLLQIMFPLIFVLYFFKRAEYFSMAIVLNWVAYSLINTSIYIGDAVKMQLPLLTGDSDGHDWNQLFVHYGLLKQTSVISDTIYSLGLVVILLALILGLYITLKKDRYSSLQGSNNN